MAKKRARVAPLRRAAAVRTSPRAAAPVDEDRDTLEGKIVRLATSGKLREAAASAIREQLDAGLSVVFQSGRSIVREHPDGTREVLHTAPARTPVPERLRAFVVGAKKRGRA